MKALICGVSDQDGSLLARLLLEKNYQVFGTSRDADVNNFSNLTALGIFDDVVKLSMAPSDFQNVLQIVSSIDPDEIYNLTGQSSVGLSFEQPAETMTSIAQGTLNILEAIRYTGSTARFYNAGSCECFGNTCDSAADETTPFSPCSPYGVAKASAFWMVNNYRHAYNLHACTGILFNHESALRPERLVTQKIVHAAANISHGHQTSLRLGNINIQRDWGFAPEYVEAMHMMLQIDEPDDFVIATGETVSLKYFLATAFEYFNLDWQAHVELDDRLLRPTDIPVSRANPHKANTILKWQPKVNVEGLIHKMCEAANQKLC